MQYHTFDISGKKVTIPSPRSYRDCARLIRSDYHRHTGRLNASLWRIWFGGLSRTSMGFSFWFRLSQHRKGWLYPLARLMAKRYKRSYGLFISPRTLIGYGFNIQHCCGIIINANAVIGNNVNIGQLTTIGSNVRGRSAMIGDYVYLGPGLNIVDEVQIGSGSCVGAGAVVTRDVPPGVTVAGVPARKISDKTHLDYIRKPYPLDDLPS